MSGSSSPVLRQEPGLCIPMNLDAFILNQKVCDTGLTRIAPITQPDYRGLRTNSAEIQHDILPHVDVTRSQPAVANSRITAVETATSGGVNPANPASDVPVVPAVLKGRVGVYVHWSLPRLYRAATSASDNLNELPVGQGVSSTSPTFRLVPNRWLVLRRIHASVPAVPEEAVLTAWIVESDRLWHIADVGAGVDVETEMSPFVNWTPGDEADMDVLNKQAGVYIGTKIPLVDWSEQGSAVPRVALTTMNSSNFCFADNTVHNPNVFSIIDNVRFRNTNGREHDLDSATCDYTVIGWHAAEEDDPMGTKGLQGSLDERLTALFCKLVYSDDLSSNRDTSGDGEQTAPCRLLSYGSILGVKFDRTAKPDTPSDNFARLFTSDVGMEPVSVGTTPLDAVLTFLQAHNANEADFFGAGASAVAKDVLALRELLYAAEDSYNSRIKAADLVYADNFASSSGGAAWHYSQKARPGEPPAEPSTVKDSGTGLSHVDYLDLANDLQLRLEAVKRKTLALQQAVFDVWWEAVSDPAGASDAARRASYQARVYQLRTDVAAAQALIGSSTTGLTAEISNIVRWHDYFQGRPTSPPWVVATTVPRPFFFQRKDPNLCIAGMNDGWPKEYTGFIPARFHAWFSSHANQQPDSSLRGAISKLFAHVVAQPDSGTNPSYKILSFLAVILLYVLDGKDHSGEIGFKEWTAQPWCPLYIEWEATYFHIPFHKWSVQILSSPVGNNHQQVRYGLKDAVWEDPRILLDRREVSGRVILTPQPVVNLQALVAQVLDMAGTPQPGDMSNQALLDGVAKLKFMSAELAGLTDGIVLQALGSHIQPNMHVPGRPTPRSLAACVAAGAPFGITAADLRVIGDEAGSTPFGTLVDFSKAPADPFKPVTHGQFRFNKLNIVDKFGQVICAIEPTVERREPRGGWADTVHPCLGDQVCPGLIEVGGQKHLNTVAPLTTEDPQMPGGYPLCSFVQLTPAINQPARLNAVFVESTTNTGGGFGGWKPSSDWEQPVWAWVVVNYADYGLQFFYL